MLKHHLTQYTTDGRKFVTSWLQLNIFGKCYCFSKRTIKIED